MRGAGAEPWVFAGRHGVPVLASREAAREPRTLGRALLPAALLCLALAAPGRAEEPVPRYLQRLDLPVAADALGSSEAVTADRATGEVFVCDSRRNRIVIFDSEGLFRYQIAGGETFGAPRDVAVDPEGYLVVLANHQGRTAIVELDFDGRFLGEIALSGIPEDAAELNLNSLALSPDGSRLYVVDMGNQVLWLAARDGSVTRRVDLAEGLEAVERRDRVLGRVDVYGDRVVVAMPSEGRVRYFDLEGTLEGEIGFRGTAACQLAFPVVAAFDRDGNFVVVDQQRMILLRWNPRGNRCIGEYYGMGTAPGFLYYPVDATLDSQGRLYVSQGFEGRVQVYEGLTPAHQAEP